MLRREYCTMVDVQKGSVVRMLAWGNLLGKLLSDPQKAELRVAFHPDIQDPKAVQALSVHMPETTGVQIVSCPIEQLEAILPPLPPAPLQLHTQPVVVIAGRILQLMA